MDSYYAGARPGPARGGGPRPSKMKSQSTKSYKKDKEETFRMKKGTDALESLHSDLKKSLLCGFESMEEVLKAKQYENTSRTIALPVSTRAVGFSTVATYSKVTSTEQNRLRLPNVTIFQIYRVLLAMVERKVFDNRLIAKLDDRDLWYNPAPFEEFKSTITSINICTQQVGALLRCLSIFKFEETTFAPLFPADVVVNGRLIPMPESLRLTNLRATVTSLANQNTPQPMRRNFANKNPIPGARFDDHFLLQNADDIIPNGYVAANLRDDLYAVKGWIEAASDLRNSRDKWFTQVQLGENSSGNESMFVSNNSENLRIVTANNVSRIEGDVTEYWWRSKISDQMTFYGTYHLGGELSSVARYLYPGYTPRTKEACSVSTKRSYREVVLAIED